mmetsp:Transcript_173760/g.556905  ORF Transcript_173760/g.556905 Transcript_173760/m.556905 type:complete len:384 (+) Transcript_173760:128-1279(+)
MPGRPGSRGPRRRSAMAALLLSAPEAGLLGAADRLLPNKFIEAPAPARRAATEAEAEAAGEATTPEVPLLPPPRPNAATDAEPPRAAGRSAAALLAAEGRFQGMCHVEAPTSCPCAARSCAGRWASRSPLCRASESAADSTAPCGCPPEACTTAEELVGEARAGLRRWCHVPLPPPAPTPPEGCRTDAASTGLGKRTSGRGRLRAPVPEPARTGSAAAEVASSRRGPSLYAACCSKASANAGSSKSCAKAQARVDMPCDLAMLRLPRPRAVIVWPCVHGEREERPKPWPLRLRRKPSVAAAARGSSRPSSSARAAMNKSNKGGQPPSASQFRGAGFTSSWRSSLQSGQLGVRRSHGRMQVEWKKELQPLFAQGSATASLVTSR